MHLHVLAVSTVALHRLFPLHRSPALRLPDRSRNRAGSGEFAHKPALRGSVELRAEAGVTTLWGTPDARFTGPSPTAGTSDAGSALDP
jgi:hypothetical protein